MLQEAQALSDLCGDLLKYSPDEARDDHGKFSDGGTADSHLAMIDRLSRSTRGNAVADHLDGLKLTDAEWRKLADKANHGLPSSSVKEAKSVLVNYARRNVQSTREHRAVDILHALYGQRNG